MAESQLEETITKTPNTFRQRLKDSASSAAAAARGAVLKGLGLAPTETQYNEISSQLKQLVSKNFSKVVSQEILTKEEIRDSIRELFKDRLLIEAASGVFLKRLEYLNGSGLTDKSKIDGVENSIEYAKIIKKNIDEKLKQLDPSLFENGVLKPPIQTQIPSSISYNPFTDPQMVMLMQNIDTKALIEGLGHMVTLGAVAVGHLASAALTSRGGKRRRTRSRRITKKIDKRKIKTHKRKGKSRKNKKSKGRKNK
jgi:hypothetical protein